MKLVGEETRVGQGQRTPEAPKEASLVQIYGPDLGQRYVIDTERVTIGRDQDNDVVLDNDNVSRFHCVLHNGGGRIEIEDLGSTNGTLVNDQDTSRCELRHGDILKVGSCMLKFLSGGNAEALYHEEIYRMTIHDGLTGVANRRYFEEFLEREIARAQRYQRPLSLVLFDIDHFKRTNDDYGHLAGDYVLRRMAGKVKTTIRREELMARYGGEEFAVIMPETPLDKALTFGEKIRGMVEAMPFEFDGQDIAVTISIGIAPLTDAIESPADLVKRADAALYEAKEGGRNRVHHA